MHRHFTLLLSGLCVGALASCASVPAVVGDNPTQLFAGLGDYHRPFSTKSELAQKYLDQGMIFTQGFNYDEAIRSFKEAARLDPSCAMAHWGVSYCEGPSYNIPMNTDARRNASWDALQAALARIDNTADVERALIEALAKRYEKPFAEDRKSLDQAYADAMGKVWERFPQDADVGMLYAEAMMILNPWKLYDDEQNPAAGTAEIESVLEQCLDLNPNLPGACHLYIHAVEQSKSPERALAAADRLCTLAPAIGHLVHMPAHIYIRCERWDRAVEQNALAVAADLAYLKLSPKQFFQHVSMTHNYHIGAYAAMMSGREAEAMRSSRLMWSSIPQADFRGVAPFIDVWMCSLYDVQKRFGRWDDLLAEPAPPEYMPITTCMWRANRAVAAAAKKDFPAALRELEAFRTMRESIKPEQISVLSSMEKVQGRLDVVEHFVPGEIALQKGDWITAITHLEKSVEAEDKLGYSGEPPEYLQPIRHTLGAVLLKAGRPVDAERVYRRDLEEFPGNGWSLYGLARALQVQDKAADAQIVEAKLATAWAKADAKLTSSCLCVPKL